MIRTGAWWPNSSLATSPPPCPVPPTIDPPRPSAVQSCRAVTGAGAAITGLNGAAAHQL